MSSKRQNFDSINQPWCKKFITIDQPIQNNTVNSNQSSSIQNNTVIWKIRKEKIEHKKFYSGSPKGLHPLLIQQLELDPFNH